MLHVREMMMRLGLVLILAVLVAIPGRLAAEEGSKDQGGQVVPVHIGAAEICPCTFGPLIADTAIPIEKGGFAIQPLVAFGLTGGDFTGSWRRVSAGGDFYSLSIPVKVTHGLFKNAEVFLVIPYVHNWARNVSEPGPGRRLSPNDENGPAGCQPVGPNCFHRKNGWGRRTRTSIGGSKVRSPAIGRSPRKSLSIKNYYCEPRGMQAFWIIAFCQLKFL